MVLPGLVSVTFRQLSPKEVLSLAVEADLRGITWGGDVHVPPGQLRHAREVGRMTADAGLEIEGFGSYYRAGMENPDGFFEENLETAVALGAPRIRVWAGAKDAETANEADRAAVVADFRRCAVLARQAGVRIMLEFHGGTLTNTAESAEALMRELGDTNISLYWQPPNGLPKDQVLAGLKRVLPWVDSIHVFHWIIDASGNLQRLPLVDGCSAWDGYLKLLVPPEGARWAMLEFVSDDAPEQFLADARQLHGWLNRLGTLAAGEIPEV